MRRIRTGIVFFLGIFVFLTTVGAGAAEPEHQLMKFTLTTNKSGERRMFVGADGKIRGAVNPNINVKEWDVVEITLINGDDLHHHIAIPDFYIMSEVVSEKGKKTTITFVPFKKGEFVYYCLLEGHREHGMEGRLLVSSR